MHGSRRPRWAIRIALALVGLLVAAGCASEGEGPLAEADGAGGGEDSDTIKVGILHSLSGTMAISETSVRDAELLAIEEINAQGGVLGKQLEPIVEDGESDWPTFAEKAEKLLVQDGVATVFGCWTSASRKAVLPVFEKHNGLLWYPVQYEGLEASPNIFYSGAAPNQQIVPAVEWLIDQDLERMFLLGSDYVFPRTANLIIKKQLEDAGAEVVGEEYTPLGHTEYSTVISKIEAAEADVVFNTLNGDSNVAFFKQFGAAGFSPEDLPTLSVSVAEQEIIGIGAENMAGHYAAWNYFQSVDTPRNREFVEAYKARFGQDRVTDDPIEAAYINVYLWAKAVEKAGTTDVDAVREAAAGITFDAPEGMVRIDGENQHISKSVRIGQVQPDGQFEVVHSTDEPVDPDPYLKTYDWAEGLQAPTG